MSNTISPNMGLIIPGVGTEVGPDWANDLNASLGTLDQHNHSSGQGVQINPSGLNINSDLAINANNLTTVKTVNFTALSGSLAGSSPNLGCLYVAGNELYYNDESGNVVPITNNGSVNAGAGSITGLPTGTASATYSSGSQTFIWQSATSTPANMDGGSFVFRNITASSKGVTLSAPSALAADYGINLFSGLPGSNSFVTLSTVGNLGVISQTAGITNSMLAANSVNTSQLVDVSVTQAKKAVRVLDASTVAAGGIGFSASSGFLIFNGTGTYFTIAITTLGNPVFIGVCSDNTSNGSYIQVKANEHITINFKNNGTTVSSYSVDEAASTLIDWFGSPGQFWMIDTSVIGVPGTYTYTFEIVSTAGGNRGALNHVSMTAYEL